jgi:hypothetical protein
VLLDIYASLGVTVSAAAPSAAVHFHRRPQVSTEVRCRPKKPPLHSHNIRSYKPRSFL